MIFIVLLSLIVVSALFIVIGSRKSAKGEGKKQNWLQFYTKGKDSGFGFKEIELLRRLAIKAKLEEPATLFWSQTQMDICIRSLVRSSRLSGTDKDEDVQDFLSRLYDYRKKIELEKPKVKNGLSGSRQIEESHPLRILLRGTGVFKSRIIKNTSQYITVARPVNSGLPGNFPWIGQSISVYFWRNDDAGYVFDTEVSGEVYSKGYPALQINHADKLFRTQKRKSVRLKIHKPAYLYLIGDETDTGSVEVAPGLKCIIDDISDSGCAITIGGKAVEGLRVKIQFNMNGGPIVMCGTVRSTDFKEDIGNSILHIEADELPRETRNQILSEVFRISSDEDEALPFKILDEEIENETENGSNQSAVNNNVV
ncbi:MAG: PilZ domain-containing protein [Spirochaetaceae bacterium]|jgi:c-di-GMP-binding flagellar brake protein YcgR|nr:PilZ domain-containing protein [Spirochaetaceae bacterium]